MAVCLIGDVPVTKEQYDAINEKIGFPGEVPDGLVSHTALENGDSMKIVDVWESRGHFDKFMEGKLMAALGEVMGEAASAPGTPPDEFQVHNRFPG